MSSIHGLSWSKNTIKPFLKQHQGNLWWNYKGKSPFETGSVGGTDTSSRSFYWCQTSIHHEHADGYWDGRQCIWGIAGAEEEVQPLSGDWRLRGVLPNWLGVSPVETEDTGGALQPAAWLVAPSARGQVDGDYPYWHSGAVVLRHPDAKPLLDTEPPDVEAQMSL